MKTVIHVNRHNIAANKKGADLPIFTVKDYKQNRKGNRVLFDGPCEFVYSPDRPLPCGAVAWIETKAEVHVE